MQYNLGHFNLSNHSVSLHSVCCLLLLFSFLILQVCLQKSRRAEQLIKKVDRMGFERQYNYSTYLRLSTISRTALRCWGRGSNPHPLHFVLWGNYGIDLSSFWLVVGQIPPPLTMSSPTFVDTISYISSNFSKQWGVCYLEYPLSQQLLFATGC